MAGLADKKNLESLVNPLAGRADKVDFVQAEQNLLFAKTKEYAEIGRVINSRGYGSDFEKMFWLYEHPNPSLFIGEMKATDWHSKMNFIKNGRLVGSELIPKVELYRLYRDPYNQGRTLYSQRVPLNNIDQVAALTRVQQKTYPNLDDESATGLVDLLAKGVASATGYKNPQPITQYGLMKYDIDSLDFELKNQNPFAASRMVNVNIKFSLQTIMALDFESEVGFLESSAASDSSTTKEKFRLRDLISFSRGKDFPNQEYYGGYGLQLRLGYQPPRVDINSKPPEYHSDLIDIVNNIEKSSSLVLELELIDYDINVDEKGKASLTLNYVSFIEDFSKRLSFDLFAGRLLTSQQIDDQVASSKAAANMREELDRISSAFNTLDTIEALIETETNRYNVIRAEVREEVFGTLDQKVFEDEYRSLLTGISEKGREYNRKTTERSRNDSYSKALSEQINNQMDHFSQNAPLGIGRHTLRRKGVGGRAGINSQGFRKKLADKRSEIEGQYDAKIAEINERLVHQNKIAKYNIFLEYLFQDRKIFETKIPTNDLVLFSNEYDSQLEQFVKNNVNLERRTTGANLDEDAEIKSAFELLQESRKEKLKNTGEVEKSKILDTHKTAAELVKDSAKMKKDDSDEETTVDETDIIMLNKLAGASSVVPRAHTDVTIYYIHLGDLIDVALKYTGVKKQMDDAGVGLILGSVKILDPLGTGEEFSINLADLPISLKYLLKWFKKNIVEPDVDKYDVTKFLQDIATQLVSPILVSLNNRFGKSSRDVVQVKNTTFSMYSLDGSNPANIGSGENSTLGNRFDFSDPDLIAQLQTFSDPENAATDNSNVYRYFYMYGTNKTGLSIPVSNATPGVSLEKIRAKHGVYSFIIGGEVYAINNTFSFKKVKKKYQTEMMAARAMEEGNEYKEMWNQFDLTIEMMGNSIFSPGMHIYGTLNTLGTYYMNADAYLASHLGLQGYYLITNVENTMKGRKWTTTITAKWQSHSALGNSRSQALPRGRN